MKPGFFYLERAEHLLEKLEWEYKNLAAHPGNAWHAFNFFVTAEHMADWKQCTHLKAREPLLALCSHIANGGKHFHATAKQHKSVTSAKHDGVFARGVFARGLFAEGVFKEELVIELEAEAAQALGATRIDAVSLASKILQFWKSNA